MTASNRFPHTREYIYLEDLAGRRGTDGLPSGEGMPAIGEKIGSSRIVKLIAEGGMATVYKVWNEDLEVFRALKMLKPGFTEETRSRLQTEAKISANLQHPNIVTIFSVDFWKNTAPYIEMEFIDGYSLKQLLGTCHRLPLPFSISVAYFMCLALEYAHSETYTLYGKVYDRLVHRDIKPANILVSNSGVPKLADFGIARPSSTSIHTVGERILGTFAYVSPEQLNGRDIDQRSDIYSLGCVLYEMITGHKAFPQTTLPELIKSKSHDLFKPISSHGIRVPRRLSALVAKSMHLNRSRRHQRALEMRRELLECLSSVADESPEEIMRCSRGDSLPVAAENRPARSLWPLVVVSITAVLLIAGCIIAIALVRPSTIRDRIAVQTEKLAGGHGGHRSGLRRPDTAPATGSRTAGATSSGGSRVKNRIPVRSAFRPALRSVPPGPLRNFHTGKTAFQSGDYSRAVAFLEKIPLHSPELGAARRDSAVYFLITSYIEEAAFEKAAALASSAPLKDGHFFIQQGIALLNVHRHEKAISSFARAQETASRFLDVHELRHEAVYLWAQALTRLYLERSPSSENRKRAAEAWQRYYDMYCLSGRFMKYCHEAGANIDRLGSRNTE